MSRLEELIKELCPNGVESIKINDLMKEKAISTITASIKLKRNEYGEAGKTPIISQEEEFISGYCDFVDNNIIDGEYICFGDHSEHIKYVDFSFVQGADGLKIIQCKEGVIEAKYFYYAASNYYQKHNNYERHYKYLLETLLPVPPLEVQREIVRILDSFTLLTAELTAELTARKKQYEFYRDELLNFDSKIPLVTLGEVATVTKLAGFEFTNYVKYSDEGKIIAVRGLNVKSGKLDLTDVKYIDNSDLSKLSRSKLHIGDMLFTYVGTIGQVAIIDEEDKYYLAPNVALIRSNSDKLIPDYMRLYFQSGHFWHNQINRLIQSSSMKNIPMEKIRQFQFPLPPVEVQKRLIYALDNFDSICSDLNIGLPAEIEARQKQYEYYRDALLTFAETGTMFATHTHTHTHVELVRLIQHVFGCKRIKVKDEFRRIKGTPITAGKMKEIENESGDIKIFAGGKTVISAFEEDIPNANITKFPSVLVQSRGVIDVVYYDKPFTFKNEMWAYTHDNLTTLKYLFYVFKANIESFRNSAAGMGSLPQISLPVTEDFEFWLPTLEEQARIVSILDRFDSLCNDISQGLPAEIEARQKQYEHYRDKLLTFEPLQ